MSEKIFHEKKVINNNSNTKNITQTKQLIQKSKITRNSQTPIKSEISHKSYLNNNTSNNNTLFPPNNNYNINNNISININIDMTNERNKSFNTKTKNKPKTKNTQLNNNNLIFNTIKNFKKKSAEKKNPFHIRIKSANFGIKDFKFKQNDNVRNKVYQNRLNYYYNISNKNNFSIFSHKFENKKPETNSNITDYTYKNISLNHTPIIDKMNKIYKKNPEKKENKDIKNNKKKQISKSTKDLIIKDQKLNNKFNIIKNTNNNKNTNSKKTLNKKYYFSPNINRNNINKNKNQINQSSTPINSNKLNRSIDNRKLNHNNNNKINSIKYNMINNNRNMSTSPFSKNKKIINHNTIEHNNKIKNTEDKSYTMIKSPVNSKINNNAFKNKNKMNNTGTNFRSPMINNKNVSKLNKNKNSKTNIEKENNIKQDKNQNNNDKEKINKANIKLNEDIIIENNDINQDIKEENKNIIDENNKEKENNNIAEEKNKEKKEDIKEDIKEDKTEEKKEEENKVRVEIKDILNINPSKNEKSSEKKDSSQYKDQSKLSAELFINEIFQSSLTFDPNPTPPPKPAPPVTNTPQRKIVSQISSICKVGYAGPGVKKKNQDNFFIYKNFLDNNDTIFLGVCDGHGMFGHDISGYLVNILPQNLHEALTKNEIKSINNDSEFQKIVDISSQTFVQTNLNMVNNASIDCTYSGSTCTSLIFSPEKIISLNVGDSRCVLGKYLNNKWTSKNLTRDHKPTEEDEKKRILEKGGRIEPYKDEKGDPIGPERVWLKGEDLPGLAMSRSFGDDVAHMIGVTSNPEIMEYKVNEEDKFILAGSDGIFEFISSDEAVNMVKDFYLKDDIEGALNHLYKISSQRWIMEEEVIDDITLIIMFLK